MCDDYGPDAIGLVLASPKCQDMSKLRLQPDRNGNLPGPEARPGLDGPKGNLFRVFIKILTWIIKYNPNVLYFVENVDFSDMKKHWKEVCDALGQPVVINAKDHSYTH